MVELVCRRCAAELGADQVLCFQGRHAPWGGDWRAGVETFDQWVDSTMPITILPKETEPYSQLQFGVSSTLELI